MNWIGLLWWVCIVSAGAGGARWGRGRERFYRLRAEVRADRWEKRADEAVRQLKQHRALAGIEDATTVEDLEAAR